MLIAVTVVSLIAIAAGIWFSPGRGLLLRCLGRLDRFRFTCRVQLIVDETKPINQDTFLCVQMIGRVPIPQDNTATNVRIELTDITESRFEPEPVLSLDEAYRSADGADFYFAAHNGIIPTKHAVISPWKTILKVPTHRLRFARRGNRRLLFKVSVLSCQTGDELVSDQQTIDYVTCQDGYRELRQRKLTVLKASMQLAIAGIAPDGPDEKVKALFLQWLDQKGQSFPAAAALTDWVQSLQGVPEMNDHQAVDCLLAYGEQTDKFAAAELAIQVLATRSEISADQLMHLSDAVRRLQISRKRYLALCQKVLLFAPCTLESPALLLGIDESMEADAYRLRLNEEYRKWNARVTHPDEAIRRQADRMLTLIAELRSRRLSVKMS